MTSIVIVGIGSPYEADQAGWLIVEMLKQDLELLALNNGNINFVICEHPGSMLLDTIADVDYAILIDALEGGRRGDVVRVEKQQLLGDFIQLSTHNLGVKEILTLGNQLNSLPQRLDLVGVAVGDPRLEYRPDAETVLQVKNFIYNAIQENLA
ncbi:hydrogenase maturation protease [Kaarinaea lacus]